MDEVDYRGDESLVPAQLAVEPLETDLLQLFKDVSGEGAAEGEEGGQAGEGGQEGQEGGQQVEEGGQGDVGHPDRCSGNVTALWLLVGCLEHLPHTCGLSRAGFRSLSLYRYFREK